MTCTEILSSIRQKVMASELRNGDLLSIHGVFSQLNVVMKRSMLDERQIIRSALNGKEQPKLHKAKAKNLETKLKTISQSLMQSFRGEAKPRIILFKDMSNSQWRRSYGRELTRRMVTYFDLNKDILPFNVEATANFVVQYDSSDVTMGRGGFLTPDLVSALPKFKFHAQYKDMNSKFAIALFDVDYIYDDKIKRQLCLYLKTDITSGDSLTAVQSSNGKVVIDYMPPHPQRGTGIHRLVAVLFKHSSKDSNNQVSSVSSIDHPVYGKRFFDIKELMEKHSLEIYGLNFCRTHWTRSVSDLCKKLKVPECSFAIPIQSGKSSRQSPNTSYA